MLHRRTLRTAVWMTWGACTGLAACGGSDPDGTAAAETAAQQAAAIPYPPTPDTDPFYAQPQTWPDVPAGTIINSRAVSFAPQGGIQEPNKAWQLQFMSRDVNGQPIAAVVTVVKPLIPATTSPAPLLSYQYAEDSLGSQCAPSHQATGSVSNFTSQIEPFLYLTGLQTQGWTLVIPDHEGPYSEYAAGRLAGHVVLDGVRAAESFAPLGLTTATPVGLWGYSGGALATAWAASLQPGYAPELNVVGVASGGTPSDLVGAAQNFDQGLGNLLFSLGLSAIVGVNRAYPALLGTTLLNAKGQAAAEDLANGCGGATGNGTPAPTGHFSDYTTEDAFTSPGVLNTAPLIDLPQPGETPTADVFVYQSTLDELIPVAGVDSMVQAWCAAGDKVHYFKAPLGEHIIFAGVGGIPALAYLVSRFDHAPVTVLPPGTQSCN
jgi:hypothetical protein